MGLPGARPGPLPRSRGNSTAGASSMSPPEGKAGNVELTMDAIRREWACDNEDGRRVVDLVAGALSSEQPGSGSFPYSSGSSQAAPSRFVRSMFPIPTAGPLIRLTSDSDRAGTSTARHAFAKTTSVDTSRPV